MKKIKSKPAVADAPLQQQGKTDEFKLIARAELHPDPDQPRKTFDEASLKELAESIAQQGIVQPLIVRLQPAKYKITEPDLTSDYYHVHELVAGGWQHAFQNKSEAKCVSFAGRDNLTDRYVIVAGERRWRAAELAGLATVPCIVRDLDAHKVFAQQFIENEQRVNISALEEAEALTKQLQARKLQVASFSVEDLAQELGMSRAGLYQRLALTRLHAPVRAALLAGKISTSVAGVVAIVPTPAAQEKLLKEITNEQSWKFPYSVREVQELVDDDYCKQLNDAPFDQKETLYGAEGGQLDPCQACPHRSGNMVEQFPELAKRPNVCTKPDCFAAKCKAYWLAKSQDLAQRGKTVLTEKEFKKSAGDLVRADKAESYRDYGLFPENWAEAPKTVLGKHAPEPVFVTTAEGVKEYYKRADIPAAAKKAKVKFGDEEKTETAEQKTKRLEKEKADNARADRRQAFVIAQIPKLLAALGKLKATAAVELGADMVKSFDGYTGDLDELEAAASKAKDPQARLLGFLFADSANAPLDGDQFDACNVVFWKRVGIDLVKEFEASEKAAQPALALPVKKDAEQANLLDVPAKAKKGKGLTPAAKAHIFAAQKARWAKIKAKK